MKGRLLFLNLLLLGLLCASSWYLREKWLEARQREAAILRQAVKPPPPPVVPPVPAEPPVAAAAYGEVAQKMLFSRDRNPTVVIDTAPPPQMPALPVAYGVLALGDVRTAILGEKPGAPHRGYRPGERVGAFKLVSVDANELVFEWNGETVVRKVQELMTKERPPQPVVAAQQQAQEQEAGATPAKAQTTVVGNATPTGPGGDVGSGFRACQPGDTAAAGTVMNGMKKVSARSPFGESCRWEPVK